MTILYWNSQVANHSRLYTLAKNYLVISIIIIGVNIIIGANLLTSESIVIRTWITSITGLIIIWLYWWKQHEGKALIDSSTMVLFGLSFTHLLPPLYLSLRLEHSFVADEFNVAGTYALTNLVTTIGAIALLVGYSLVNKRPIAGKTYKTRHIINMTMTNSVVFLFFFAIIAWTSRIIMLMSGVYYYINADYSFMGGRWYSVLGQISYYGLMLPMMLWLLSNQNKRWLLWGWIFTILELAWVIPTGGRQYIIQVCLSLILVKINNLREIPWVKILLIGVVILIAFPILGQLRYTSGKYLDINEFNLGTAQYQAFKEATEVVKESDSVLIAIDYIISRFYDGQFLGYLLKNYRHDYEWEYGKTYSERLPYILMPNFINPDRPIMQVPLGQWYQLIAGGSQPTTYLGEAYINFGYIGIVSMAFVLGVILGLFENLFRKFSGYTLFTAAYLFFLVTFIYKVSTSLAVWLADIRNIVLFVIILYAINRLPGLRIIELRKDKYIDANILLKP